MMSSKPPDAVYPCYYTLMSHMEHSLFFLVCIQYKERRERFNLKSQFQVVSGGETWRKTVSYAILGCPVCDSDNQFLVNIFKFLFLHMCRFLGENI